jgi:tetratricopeptide (TPR) repeat protein
MNIGEILITQGRLDEGEEAVRSARRVMRSSGGGWPTYSEQLLARIELARGNAAEAEKMASGVVREFSALGASLSALEASLLQAQAVIELGRPNDALTIVREAESAAGAEAAALQTQIRLASGQALIELNRLGEADEAIEAGLRAAREQGLPYEEARLLQLRSRVRSQSGDIPGAQTDVSEAGRILASIGAAL